MNTDNDIQSNDLTQLSSREQLSALMDGALPPDQTRFLLRRLQHDAGLADSWEHWRLTGEAMRGLAPTRRMPADFAGKVMAALQAEVASQPQPTTPPRPQWRTWGVGGALAAALALVAVLGLRPDADSSVDGLSAQVASVTSKLPAPQPAPQPKPQPAPVFAEAPAALAAATAAVVARPARRTSVRHSDSETRSHILARSDVVPATQVAALPAAAESKIVTKPWPRSILPQYRGGDLTVGYGEHVRAPATMNPFPPQLFAPAAEHEMPNERQAPDVVPAQTPIQH